MFDASRALRRKGQNPCDFFYFVVEAIKFLFMVVETISSVMFIISSIYSSAAELKA